MPSIFPGAEPPALFAHLMQRYLICRRWRRASPGERTEVRKPGVEGRMPSILDTRVERGYPVEHTSVMQVTSDRVHIYGLSDGDPSARLQSPRNLDSTICSLCNQPFTDCDNCMKMVHLAGIISFPMRQKKVPEIYQIFESMLIYTFMDRWVGAYVRSEGYSDRLTTRSTPPTLFRRHYFTSYVSKRLRILSFSNFTILV